MFVFYLYLLIQFFFFLALLLCCCFADFVLELVRSGGFVHVIDHAICVIKLVYSSFRCTPLLDPIAHETDV